jgi:hypothetical protein
MIAEIIKVIKEFDYFSDFNEEVMGGTYFFTIINGVTFRIQIFDEKNIKYSHIYLEDNAWIGGRLKKELIYTEKEPEIFKNEFRKFIKEVRVETLYEEINEVWYEEFKKEKLIRNADVDEVKLKKKLNEIFKVKTIHEREVALYDINLEKTDDGIAIFKKRNEYIGGFKLEEVQ